VSTTAVAAVVLRKRNTVHGEIISVVHFERPWVRTDAVLGDGTGTLVLRFFGRAAVPGLVSGRRIVAQGTPGRADGTVVIINPLYSFTTGECASGTSW
jgi:hypothetical protein